MNEGGTVEIGWGRGRPAGVGVGVDSGIAPGVGRVRFAFLEPALCEEERLRLETLGGLMARRLIASASDCCFITSVGNLDS